MPSPNSVDQLKSKIDGTARVYIEDANKRLGLTHLPRLGGEPQNVHYLKIQPAETWPETEPSSAADSERVRNTLRRQALEEFEASRGEGQSSAEQVTLPIFQSEAEIITTPSIDENSVEIFEYTAPESSINAIAKSTEDKLILTSSGPHFAALKTTTPESLTLTEGQNLTLESASVAPVSPAVKDIDSNDSQLANGIQASWLIAKRKDFEENIAA